MGDIDDRLAELKAADSAAAAATETERLARERSLARHRDELESLVGDAMPRLRDSGSARLLDGLVAPNGLNKSYFSQSASDLPSGPWRAFLEPLPTTTLLVTDWGSYSGNAYVNSKPAYVIDLTSGFHGRLMSVSVGDETNDKIVSVKEWNEAFGGPRWAVQRGRKGKAALRRLRPIVRASLAGRKAAINESYGSTADLDVIIDWLAFALKEQGY